MGVQHSADFSVKAAVLPLKMCDLASGPQVIAFPVHHDHILLFLVKALFLHGITVHKELHLSLFLTVFTHKRNEILLPGRSSEALLKAAIDINGTVFAVYVKIHIICQRGEYPLQMIPAVHQLPQPDFFCSVHEKDVKVILSVLLLHQTSVVLHPQNRSVLAADSVFHIIVCV